MTIAVIDAETVERVLTMPVCIDLMAQAQAAISRGEIELPLRTVLPVAGENTFYVMPGETPDPPVFGAKLCSRFAANPSAGFPAIQGQIVLFDSRDGAPIGLIEAASVTGIRTAAASGAATRALARDDAHVVALLGYGVQARTHLEAMRTVRPVDEVRVWGPSIDKARHFAETEGARQGVVVTAVETSQEAVTAADLICGVSNADEAIIEGPWVSPGAHLNLVGAHGPTHREAGGDVMAAARIFTEVTAFGLAESGDLNRAMAEGKVSASDIVGEVGDVIDGRLEGRTSDDDITAYLSHGNTAQDLYAAHYILQNAG
ncbi:MAG: ornithine cyclodeaminase family protein [Acidobacteriota bacterium]|nr:ornithine cyclodeaminase family protein [Acidobacteriota bacterium]